MTIRRYAALLFCTLTLLASPRLAQAQNHVKYWGYQFAEVDNPYYPHHDTADLDGKGNVISYEYYPGYTPPGDLLRYHHMKAVFVLPVPEDVLFGTSTYRRSYFNGIKTADEEDILGITAIITLGDEWFTRLHKGQWDSWSEFSGLTMGQKIDLMQDKLEETIDDVKYVFPGIPIELTENYWGTQGGTPWAPPPSNVDILGLDWYWFNYGDDSCGSTAKASFLNDVETGYNAADAYGKPLLMTAGAFRFGPAPSNQAMMTPCQLGWYLELAENHEVVAILWWLYNTVVDPLDSTTWYGMKEEWASDQLAWVTSWGEAYANANIYEFIDSPSANATVSGSSITISGWALDFSALPNSTTAGIDTIHVWAFPTGGGSGVWLGIPTLHQSRTDVAAAAGGAQFELSGYSLNTSALSGHTGWFDIVVYAHSGETGTFTWLPHVRTVYVQ